MRRGRIHGWTTGFEGEVGTRLESRNGRVGNTLAVYPEAVVTIFWRCVRQHQAEKLAQRKRIGRPPPDRALRVEALEIADQQQPEVATGRQPWPAVFRVEPLAEAFDILVEILFVAPAAVS